MDKYAGFNVAVAELIRQRMQEVGMTAKELAEKVGYSTATIKKIEGMAERLRLKKISGKGSEWSDITIPTFYKMHLIADALGVGIEYFIPKDDGGNSQNKSLIYFNENPKPGEPDMRTIDGNGNVKDLFFPNPLPKGHTRKSLAESFIKRVEEIQNGQS